MTTRTTTNKIDTEDLFRELFEVLGITYPDADVLVKPYDDIDGQPHPQRMAIESQADELFYGGSAGGGKSFLLLILALRYFYNSIIYRRQKNEIESLYLESRDLLLDTRSQYNKNKHVWEEIPGNRRLEFGGVQYEKDISNYMGRPHDLTAFDEITSFPESTYRFLTIWNRTTRKNHRPRVVVTGNPPTNEEGMWVIKYWGAWLDPEHPNPAKEGELRWYVMDGDDEVELLTGDMYVCKSDGRVVKPTSRTFIRATIKHNPKLLATGYGDKLNALPGYLRDAFRDGKFLTRFEDADNQCIPTSYVLEAQARWEKPDPETRWIAAGMDIARGGKDSSVLARFDGSQIDRLIEVPGKNTPTGLKTVEVFEKYIDRTMKLYIDANTWGADAQQQFKLAGYKAVAVNASNKTHERDEATKKWEFSNLRAQLYWRLREMLSPESNRKIALPPDRQLLIELCAPKFFQEHGKIILEDKATIKARIGGSPDRADAVVMALKHAGRRAKSGQLEW